MKLYFAAAAALVLLASAPSQAASVMSGGRSNAQDCAMAAGSSSSLTSRGFNNGIAACDAAMKGDLSHTALAGTLVNRGIIQASAGHDSEAVTDFNAAIARDDRLAAAYMNRGTAMLRADRYDEARSDFDRAISLNANDLHVAYFNRGEAQEASGNLLAAYHDYRHAQELAPNFKPASLELARFQVNDRRMADVR
jgi:tetratricopeptide (TPR) repeat protein